MAQVRCTSHLYPNVLQPYYGSRASLYGRSPIALEPREHGATSPVAHIREAIADLHASAEALAATFAVDLTRAHQTRLEALLGTPLHASLVEEREEGR